MSFAILRAMQPVKRHKAIHISWRISFLCLGILFGVAAAALLDLSFTARLTTLAVACVLLFFGFRQRNFSACVLVLAAGLLIGTWRGSHEQVALSAYQQHFDTFVTLQGVVSEDVSRETNGEVRMQLRDVAIDGQSQHGKVWASTQTAHHIKRGDTVQLSGMLETGFGNLAASMSPAELRQVTQTSRSDYALQARDWFASGIRQAIPEPQASLGSGFLTGQHSSLPGDLEDQLKVVGLTHAVVASGSNLTILVGFTRRLFTRVSKYTATIAGACMTAGFVLIAGMSPSMTRAGLVTGLSLAAWYYGRRIHPFVLLPLAAAITVIANPSYLWGDIGWYLSFGAFAGVLILAPLIQNYLWGPDYKPNIMMEIFIGTTAAQIATMPIILISFGVYSSYALAANMLVLPLVPVAMLLTFVGGIAGLAAPAIASLVGWPGTIVMQYMTTIIDRIATLPGAQDEISYGLGALIVSYGALIVSCIYMMRMTRHNFRTGTNILLGERS